MAGLYSRLFLDLRTAVTGGAVGQGWVCQGNDTTRYLGPEQTAALRADTAGRSVVFIAHGFNVDRDAGIAGLGAFMDLVAPSLGDSLLVSVLWPGDSMFGFLSYSFEGPSADDSGAVLAKRIQDWFDPTARLSFVAHSKGCRLVMRCIQDLLDNRTTHKTDQICLMAAAMDNTCL